jgi:hypothetical protein
MLKNKYVIEVELHNELLLKKLQEAEVKLAYLENTPAMTQLIDKLKKEADYARGFYDNFCCNIFDEASTINNDIDESHKIAD